MPSATPVRARSSWTSLACVPALIALLTLPPALHVHADLIEWINPAGGTFSTGTNWGGGAPPGAADTAVFNLPGSMFTVNFTADVTNQSLLINNGQITFDLGGSTYTLTSSVRVGDSAGDNASLTITGGTLASSGPSRIGFGGSTGHVTVTGPGTSWNNGNQFLDIGLANSTGTMMISEGATVISGFANIGLGGSGQVVVSGTGSTWDNAGFVVIGRSGEGTLTIEDGGFVFNASGTIGLFSGSNGTVTVTGNGSVWQNTGSLTVGDEGDGMLMISDGGLVTSDGLSFIGDVAGSTGDVTVTGDDSLWINDGKVVVGSNGHGMLTISDGGRVFSTSGSVGEIGGSGIALITGQNSIWDIDGPLTISEEGDGTLVISAGGSVNNFVARIGEAADAVGEVLVAGDGSRWNNNDALFVGVAGHGTLVISDGGEVINADEARIGSSAGSSGTVLVTGEDSSWTLVNSTLHVGHDGEGSLTISDGGTVSGTLPATIGTMAGSTGTVTVSGSGSTWINTNRIRVGDEGNGTLVISGGGFVENSTSNTIARQPGSVGTVFVTGSGSTWMHSTANLEVGTFGIGSLIIEHGGSVFSSQGLVGVDPGSEGLVIIAGDGSTWSTTNDLKIGDAGNGTLLITDSGALVHDDRGSIGDLPDGTGEVVVAGVGSTWINDGPLTIGKGGAGTLTIADGGVVTSGPGTIGRDSGSVGEVLVSGSGSTWTLSGAVDVALNGHGTLIIEDGGVVSATSIAIADNIDTSDGVVVVTGGGSTLISEGSLSVGEQGNATLVISDGAQVINTFTSIGHNAGSSGSVVVSGPGSSWTNFSSLDVGSFGDATLIISDSAKVSNTFGLMADGEDSVSNVVVTGPGSMWTNSESLSVGIRGDATLIISNGGSVTNADAWLAEDPGSFGRVTVTGPGSTWNSSGNVYVGGSEILGPGGTGLLTVSNGGRVKIGGDFTVYDTGSLALAFEYTANPDLEEKIVVGGQAFLLGDAAIDMLKIDDEPIFTGDQRIVIETGEGIEVEADEVTVTSNVLNQNVANNIEWLAEVRGDDLVLTANILDVTLADFAEGRNNIAVAMAIDSSVIAGTFDEALKGNLMSLAHTTRLNDGLHALLPLQHHSATLSSIRTTQMLNHGFAGEMASQRRGLGGLGNLGGTGAGSLTGLLSGSGEGGVQLAMLAHDPSALSYALNAITDSDDDAWLRESDKRWGGFARGIGLFDRVDSGRERTGHRANIGGIHAGIDNRLHHDWTVGLSGAYAFTDLTFRNRAGNGDLHTFRIGPYASWTPERIDGLYVDASITYGYHRNEIDRNITLGNFSEVARSRYNAHDVSVFATAGYDIALHDRTTLTPMLAMQFTHLRRDGFTERGAPGANLRIDSGSTDSLRTVLGAKLTHVIDMGDWALVPEIYVGWAHEYLDRTTDITARFAGTADPFITRGSNVSRNSVLVAGGVSALIANDFSVFVRYEGDIQSSRTTHAVVAGIGFRF